MPNRNNDFYIGDEVESICKGHSSFGQTGIVTEIDVNRNEKGNKSVWITVADNQRGHWHLPDSQIRKVLK